MRFLTAPLRWMIRFFLLIMENKKSFLIYCDLIHTVKKMPDDKAGLLFKHLLAYVNDLSPVTEDLIVELTFEPIKQQLKRDLDKWNETKEIKSLAGIMGNLKRWHPDLHQKVIDNQLSISEAKVIADNRKVSQTDVLQSQTVAKVAVNVTDTVNDTVTVNVNDTVNVTDIKKENKINSNTTSKISFSQDVISCTKNCLNYFDEHLQPKTPREKNAWCKTVQTLNERDNIPFDFIQVLTKEIRKDDFWSKNFLSLNKLAKKNKDGVPYIVVFAEHIKAKNKAAGVVNMASLEKQIFDLVGNKTYKEFYGNK